MVELGVSQVLASVFLAKLMLLLTFGRYDERILRVTMPIAGCNSRLRKRYAATK